MVDGACGQGAAGDARGALVVAVTVVAEVGDFRRFANARQLMAYLGLMSESAWNKDPVFGVIGIQSGL